MSKLFKILLLGFLVTSFFYMISQKNTFLGNHIEKNEMQKPSQLILIALAKYKKPVRIEIETFTDKYKDEIKEIRKLKIALDQQSKHYTIVQLFSDDTDEKSPLVAQIQFKDAKTNNLLNEESLNLN